MAETITPVVYGGRAKWAGALALHALSAATVAALFGAALGGLGALTGAPFGGAGLVPILTLAALYGASAVFDLPVPVPQMARQVPDWWRTFFSPPITAVLYGAGLGIGFLTFLSSGALVVVAVAAVLTGDPLTGALLLLPFGLARGLSPVVSARVLDREEGRELVDRLTRGGGAGRRMAAGAAITLVALTAGLELTTKPGRQDWIGLAALTLAASFAWASAWKLLARRRWRRTLEAHRLPAAVEALAGPLVPALEGAVPLLVLLGLPAAAGLVALVLVTSFTVEVARVGVRLGRDVPCGCFGPREERPALVLVARNLILAGLSWLVLLRAHDDPVLDLPGVPGPGEILPMMLATLGLAAALAVTGLAWFWLRRRT